MCVTPVFLSRRGRSERGSPRALLNVWTYITNRGVESSMFEREGVQERLLGKMSIPGREELSGD